MRLWMQLTCGRGPAECAWVVPRLLREVAAEAAQNGLSVEPLECLPGRYSGTLYSVLVAIEGEQAEAFCQSWVGTICWIGRSPFRPACKRKNWYVGLEALNPPRREIWKG